jgi:hypothetical protein
MDDMWIGKTITRHHLRNNPIFYDVDGQKIFPIYGSSGDITARLAIAIIHHGFLRTYIVSSDPENGDLTIERRFGKDGKLD